MWRTVAFLIAIGCCGQQAADGTPPPCILQDYGLGKLRISEGLLEGNEQTSLVKEGSMVSIEYTAIDKGIDLSTVYLSFTPADGIIVSRFIRRKELVTTSAHTLRYSIPQIKREQSGVFSVYGRNHRDKNAAENGDKRLDCVRITVISPPELPTNFHCITDNYVSTRCVWRTGRGTNFGTNYSTLIMFSSLGEYIPKISPIIYTYKCETKEDPNSGDFHEMGCSPKELSLKDEWIYRLGVYVFLLLAENPAGSVSTGPYFYTMRSALRTSPVTSLNRQDATKGISANNPITWGGFPQSLPSKRLDPITSRIRYTPIACPAGARLEEFVGKMAATEDKWEHRPTGLTPGLNYSISVSIRPNATFVRPQEIYWSNASVLEAPTPEAPPSAAPVFDIHKASAKLERAILISWQALPCENRGTTGAVIHEVRVRGGPAWFDEIFELTDQPHYVAAEGIQPSVEYSVEIRARNNEGAGPWSAVRLYTTPPTAAQAEPPREVSVDNVTSTTATVSWRPSRNLYTSASFYKLRVEPAAQKGGGVNKKIIEQVDRAPRLRFAQGGVNNKTEERADSSIRLRAAVTELSACTAYTVNVHECAQSGACGPPAEEGCVFYTAGECPDAPLCRGGDCCHERAPPAPPRAPTTTPSVPPAAPTPPAQGGWVR